MLRFNLIKFHIRALSTDVRGLSGTLTQRFQDYLENNQEDETIEKSRIIEHVEMISEKAKGNFHRIKLMDKSYMNSLRNQMREEDIIGCLEYLVKSYPSQIVNLRFFNEALKIILNNPEICLKHFVKLCFIAGSLKKHHPGPQYLDHLINNYLDIKLSRNELNRMDFSIICISTYKSSVRVNSKKFQERLIQEVLSTDDDDTFLLVALIKSLKQNQIESIQVIKKLEELNNKFKFDYASLIHILPYIADNSIKNDKLVESICERCIKTFDENVRAKDVQKFLHSCAMLNLKMKNKELERLEDIILDRISTDEFDTHFDHFVNAVLSLWILNHHSEKLVNILFEDKRFHRASDPSRIKLDSRMKLLMTCVEMEKPKWMKLKTAFPSFIANRQSPNYLIKSSLEKALNEKLEGKNGMYVQQIRNLNIAGIYVASENIHYEILDKSTSLSDKESYNGIFQLKLRLLRKLKCNVKIVPIF